MEEFQQTIGDFLDEEGKVLPFKRQLTFHHTIDYDQNLNIKVSIPHFTGEEQLEEVLYQLNEVERVFEFLNLLEKVKLVAIKLKGQASSWWQQVQRIRVQSGKKKIYSWDKMQQQIRSRFFPLNYEGIPF